MNKCILRSTCKVCRQLFLVNNCYSNIPIMMLWLIRKVSQLTHIFNSIALWMFYQPAACRAIWNNRIRSEMMYQIFVFQDIYYSNTHKLQKGELDFLILMTLLLIFIIVCTYCCLWEWGTQMQYYALKR